MFSTFTLLLAVFAVWTARSSRGKCEAQFQCGSVFMEDLAVP
jgi:hypothetical protein